MLGVCDVYLSLVKFAVVDLMGLTELIIKPLQPKIDLGGRGGSVVELRTPEREVQGWTPRQSYSVLEQDTLRFPKYW